MTVLLICQVKKILNVSGGGLFEPVNLGLKYVPDVISSSFSQDL